MAEHCRFYVLPPLVSVLCPSPGHVRTKVQGEQVCCDPSQPGLTRTSVGLFQFLEEGPIIAFRDLAWSSSASQCATWPKSWSLLLCST